MTAKMQDSVIADRLVAHPAWVLHNGKLRREFKFSNFVTAFGFMTSAAIEAEKMNHHPEWSNVYNKVIVDLVTHSADGITELDFSLAAKLDALAGSLRQTHCG